MKFISLSDIFLVPLYIAMVMTVIILISRKYKNPTIKKFFIYGALAKILAGQAVSFLYIFYYKYGDTLRYFSFGEMYKDLILYSENLSFWDVLFMGNEDFVNIISYRIDYAYGFAESSFVVNKISGLLSLISFSSFLVITIFFSILSFSGIWMMFKTFCNMYPRLYREFAFAILFFPSVTFWGSGLMKDSLCIGALGWLTWGIYNLFIAKGLDGRTKIYSLIAVFLTINLLASIKVYIVMAFLLGALTWIFFHYRDKVQNKVIKALLIPITILLLIPVLILGLQLFAEELGKYAIENIADTAYSLNAALSKGDAGSSYDIGLTEPTLAGLISKAHIAIIVTLFRPFLWEVNNPIMLAAAIESILILYFTIRVIFKVGITKVIPLILNNSVLLFCFVYSLIFAFAVGITSSNFGTLVRYKIPCMSFYLIGLVILYYVGTGGDSFFNRKKA